MKKVILNKATEKNSNKEVFNKYREVYLTFQKTLLKLLLKEGGKVQRQWLKDQIKKLGESYSNVKSKLKK